MTRRATVSGLAVAAVAAAGALAACGSEGVDVSARYRTGAELFAARCSGCHTLQGAGTEGSATNIRDRERTDGPNLNQRKETVAAVLYAIRNGGFSGAIMPQNIVTGGEAQAVAAFVAKYAGKKAKTPVSPSKASPSPESSSDIP